MTNNSEKYIISEFYELKFDKRLIAESEKTGRPLIMTGILQKADTLNRNGRVYPYEILKREVDKYMELVENNTAGGELDHPDSAVVSLANVSHRITEMWWNGKDLYGKVLIAEETPAGQILKGLLKAGFMLGISSRGVGSVKNRGNQDIVQEDFELIAFDFVSSPSTPGAYLFKEGKGHKIFGAGMIPLSKSSGVLTIEGVQEKLSNYQKMHQLANSDFWKNI
ncbi:MAG: primosomal protein [Nanoarchaeota archaeon]